MPTNAKHAKASAEVPADDPRLVPRAVTLPIAGPEDPADWPALREACRQAFRASTRLANWAIRELARADTAPAADDRIPKMPRIYLYGLAREQGMDLGEPTSRTTIFRMAEQKYRASRLETRHLGTKSLPSFRYPAPVPFPSQKWTPSVDPAGGHAVASIRFGGRRWSLRLRDPGRHKRQLDRWRRIASGELKYGEASIYEVPAQAGDHRNGMDDSRTPGGGKSRITRLMFKAVVWLPVTEKQRSGTLHVRTDPESFWVYTLRHRDRSRSSAARRSRPGAGWPSIVDGWVAWRTT